MLQSKLTWWILGILILVVAFLWGYQSGLNSGLGVGYNQAHNDNLIFRLFGGRRSAAPGAPSPAVTAEQAAAAAAQQAAIAAAEAANPLAVENPLSNNKVNPFE